MSALFEDNGCDSDHLEALDRDDCILRLKAHGVGRIGATLRGRPLVYPVNYAVHDDAVVIRTRAGGDIDLATDDAWAALEIDGADSLYHEGWSVLVVGLATHVRDPFELPASSSCASRPGPTRAGAASCAYRLTKSAGVVFGTAVHEADPLGSSSPVGVAVAGGRKRA